MDKIRDIRQYINTVRENSDFFKEYYFHSLIDLNLVKLDSILKNGILSKSLIEQKQLLNLYTHDGNDFDSKNGNKYISLTEYTDATTFNALFESFAMHTLTSISLLVNREIDISKMGERQSYFDDELFCFNSITISNINGIIMPEHLSNMPINEVNCLTSDISSYKSRYIKNWVECMEKYFQSKIPTEEIRDSLNQLWDLLNSYEYTALGLALKRQRELYGKDIKDVLASVLHNLWSEKLVIDNPKFIDVVKKINENQLPIYEIKQKTLKRLN